MVDPDWKMQQHSRTPHSTGFISHHYSIGDLDQILNLRELSFNFDPRLPGLVMKIVI